MEPWLADVAIALQSPAMAGYRCPKCGKVAMMQKMCCGRPMQRA